jgi:hypothetical protein
MLRRNRQLGLCVLVMSGVAVLSACGGSGLSSAPSTLAPLEQGQWPTQEDGETEQDNDSGSSGPTLPPITIEPVPLSALILRSEGLGEVPFGAEPEMVISYVSGLLGSPTADTGWVEVESALLLCERESFRQVEWGVLRLEFGDLTLDEVDQMQFIGWDYGLDGRLGEQPEGIITELGVGLGARVDELLDAYPAAQLFEGDEGNYPPSFIGAGGLEGFTTGTGSSDVVTVLKGGTRCGW